METNKTTMTEGRKGGILAFFERVPGQAWMVLAMLSFASGNVYDQAATQNINRPDPLVAAAIQSGPVLLYGLLAYAIFALLRKREQVPPNTSEKKLWRGRAIFAVAGIFTQIGTAAFFQALIVSRFQGLNITLPFVQSWQLMGILLGVVLLKEKPTRSLYIGMLIMVLGLAGVAVATHANEDPFKSPDWYWAIPFGLGAAFCWAMAAILSRLGMQNGVTPFGGLAVQYLAGGLVAFLLSALQGHASQYGSLDSQVLWYLIGGAVINGVMATGFLTFALRIAPAYKVLPINAVYPALAVLLGWLVLGDKNRPDLLAFSSLLVAAGGLIYTQLGPALSKGKPGES